jgi:hypothetical protein
MKSQHMKNNILPLLFLYVSIMLAAAWSRLIPHPMNFAPMGALALFGAAYFRGKYQILGLALPLLTLFISDLFINNLLYKEANEGFIWAYEGWWVVYGTMLLTSALAIPVLKIRSPFRILGAALGASAVFFLVTNFACWPGNPLYAQDASGLVACYAAGLPFLKGTVAGNLIYSAVLFGLAEWTGAKIFNSSVPTLS